MKRIALVAAIFAVAACSRTETPATDTTTPAMAPAPAADSVNADSIRAADSVKAATKTP